MSDFGQKIIADLHDAVAGNLTRVAIQGQTWIREGNLSEREAKLKAEVHRLREQLRPDLRELLLFEAAERGYKIELEHLREFYAAVTAPGVAIASHISTCAGWNGHASCDCGGCERQNRIDKALAAAPKTLHISDHP